MTTVAWDGKTMACDSCWSYENAVDTLQNKITRLPNGALLGQAGDNDARDIIKFLSGVKSPAKLPSRSRLQRFKIDFLGLMVFSNGRVFKIATATDYTDQEYDVGLWEVNAGINAIGTGAMIAMGALAAGACAREAVEIACRYDVNSRTPIHTFTLNDNAKSKR